MIVGYLLWMKLICGGSGVYFCFGSMINFFFFLQSEKICCLEGCKKCAALHWNSPRWNKATQVCKYFSFPYINCFTHFIRGLVTMSVSMLDYV